MKKGKDFIEEVNEKENQKIEERENIFLEDGIIFIFYRKSYYNKTRF